MERTLYLDKRPIKKARLVLRTNGDGVLTLPEEATEEEAQWYAEFANHIKQRLGDLEVVVRGRWETPFKIRLQTNAKELVATFEVDPNAMVGPVTQDELPLED